MRTTAILIAALIAAPASAQTANSDSHTINVTGHGKTSLPPDTANIHYWLRGEGPTPDDATRSMADAKTKVESGLKDFLGPDAEITGSDLIVIEVRDPNCKTEMGRASLSQGDCAIIGYAASVQADVITGRIDKAGTAVGLASRLGARDARLQGFELRDMTAARQTAMTRAVADARAQAQVLATASGGRLGRVLNIQYGSYGGSPVIVAARTYAPAPPPPPPPPPPPVEIDMKPRPQEVTADVSVSYELVP